MPSQSWSKCGLVRHSLCSSLSFKVVWQVVKTAEISSRKASAFSWFSPSLPSAWDSWGHFNSSGSIVSMAHGKELSLFRASPLLPGELQTLWKDSKPGYLLISSLSFPHTEVWWMQLVVALLALKIIWSNWMIQGHHLTHCIWMLCVRLRTNIYQTGTLLSLTTSFSVAWKSLCRLCWPWTHSNPPVSVFPNPWCTSVHHHAHLTWED